MSVPPVLPALPPPLRSPAPPVIAPPPRISRALLLATLAAGIVQLLLVLIVPVRGAAADSIAHRTGAVIGATVVWPLIVLGLFSLGRRFRNARSRATILLVVWSLFVLAHLGSLSRQRLYQQRIAGPNARSVVATPETNDLPAANVASPAAPATGPAASSLRADAPDEPASFDFSAGSDERLIKLIARAQEHRYHAVVAAYIEAGKNRPHDATLALERVKFIEHFASAEDIEIDSAESDLKAATDDLKRRFPNAPEAVLHELDNLFGPEFEAAANRYAHLVERWPAADRARFFLQRANAAEFEGETARTKNFARRSFNAKPSPEAALILARLAHAENQKEECLRYLTHPALHLAEPWQKGQKMNLLFELGRPDAAAELYTELATAVPFLVNNSSTAMHLARSGRVEAARKILRELPTNEWNRTKMARDFFQFELEFGSAGEAGSAYRTMRALGIATDPFLRDRVTLLLKHPGLAWTLEDTLGAFLAALLFLGVLVAPLVVLIPVHYWSLVRQRAGNFEPRSGPGWGLRQAWIALAALLVTEVATLWALQPEWLRAWWTEAQVEMAATDRSILLRQSIGWLVLGCILCLLLWGAGKWKLLGRGRWSTGRTIGMALGATLLLRIVLLAYAVVWPEAVLEPVASVDSQTRQLFMALLRAAGPLGLIGAIAVLVPVLEELLFRGVLLEALAKHVPFGWANTVQAVAFAAVHENYRLFPFYVVFGIVAGLLARRSGSLLPATIMHGCHNFLVAVALIRLGG